ncbi:DUF922 domain-containing protein [Maribacter halichondriae]|uniref:DUF922 domain-containing protein n=1 Tax=Maribacter halichondriae TaxID=2980554 RepID=UPI002358DF35|nr:DUF922 domain-containing protein [Maribacter sp. Hal144]
MGPLKNIFLSALFLVTGFVFSQEEETIDWSSERKLQWEDFKGRPFKTAWAAAVTASGITYEFSSVEEAGNLQLDIEISTHFYPAESWFQPGLVNGVILSHEQLHFDISELFARKMRERVAETTFTKNVKAEIKQIYKDILKELSAFQKKYDYETNFSRNFEKQLQWNQDILDALQ